MTHANMPLKFRTTQVREFAWIDRARCDNVDDAKTATDRERAWFATKFDALAEPHKKSRARADDRKTVLVLDTETETDPRQRVRIVPYAIFEPIDDDDEFELGDSETFYVGYEDCIGSPGNRYRRIERGFAYDDRVISETEAHVLIAYCTRKNTELRNLGGDVWYVLKSIGSFAIDTLRHRAFKQDMRIVGFNLPFDLAGISDAFSTPSKEQAAKLAEAGIAAGVGGACSRDTGEGSGIEGDAEIYDEPVRDAFRKARDRKTRDHNRVFRDGFSLIMCGCRFNPGGHYGKDCRFHPRIRIKKLGLNKHVFQWSTVLECKDGNKEIRKTNGDFVDVQTVGLALRKPDNKSLKGMCETYRDNMGAFVDPAYKFKNYDVEHGKELTDEYLDYAMGDVEDTFKLYLAVKIEYDKHNVKTSMARIYSEASLAKAYYDKIGIKPFLKAQPDFPKEILGYAMQAFYAGRSEIRYRRKPCEVMVCDFKSAYPTINALLGLQRYLLAERITCEQGPHVVNEVGNLLAEIFVGHTQQPANARPLDWFLNPDNWKRLNYLVKVYPNGGLLPIRTDYGDGDAINGCQAYAQPTPACEGLWYTLPHLLQAMIISGGLEPLILDAVRIDAGGQYETRPVELMDGSKIDLSREDFFTAIIDRRSDIKARGKAAPAGSDEQARCKSQEQALKLLANSGSYGILVEFQSEDADFTIPLRSYSDRMQQVMRERVDIPGRYFFGPMGAFITAGAWLLLALAEQQARGYGIRIAACDTDSLFFRRPDEMPAAEFIGHVKEIVAWFRKLSPYRDKSADILQIEDANYRDKQIVLPYFYGVSSKRYVLYNVETQRRRKIPVVRKSTEHGLGSYRLSLGSLGNEHRWRQRLADCGMLPADNAGKRIGWRTLLWIEYLHSILNNREFDTSKIAELHYPQYLQVTVSTWKLYEGYKRCRCRPFAFFIVAENLLRERLYAPLSNDVTRAGLWRKVSDHSECANPKLRTLACSIADYFAHPDHKWADPEACGQMEYQRLYLLHSRYCGKDTNARHDDDGISFDLIERLCGDERPQPIEAEQLMPPPALTAAHLRNPLILSFFMDQGVATDGVGGAGRLWKVRGRFRRLGWGSRKGGAS